MSPPVRVLHVDDDPEFADLAATLLEREDDRLRVETAASAAEGLDRLAEVEADVATEPGAGDGIDCVVSDYDMPGLNGIEFLERVRADYGDLPFVLFTGEGSEAVASDAIDAGVDHYLQKGTGSEQYALLANKVLTAVEKRRGERARRRQLDAIESVREGIGILDEDGRFVYVNRAYADLYGYEPDELLGEGWELLHRDGDVPDVRETVLPVVEETGSWRGKAIGRRADGSMFVEDKVISRTDGGGLVCTVRDVSEREEREWAIERLHEATRDLLRADTPGEAAELAADAARDILGYPINVVRLVDEAEDALRPVAVTQCAQAEMGERPVYPIDGSPAGRAYREGEPVVYEDVRDLDDDHDRGNARAVVYLPVGTHGTISIAATEVGEFDRADVELVRVLAANTAAALDRIEREREVRAAETRYRTLVDHFPDGGVFLYDEDLTCLLAGGQGLSDVGLAPEDVEGERPRDRYPAGIAAELETHLRDALDGERATFDQTYGGQQYRVWTLPVGDEPVDHAMAVSRNVTDRTERERELRRYEHIVNGMQEAACIYDEDGRFEVVNESLAEFYDTTPDALVGERSGLIPAIRAEAEGEGDPYRELIAGERDEIGGTIEAEFPGHGRAAIEYRLTPLRIDGEIEGIVGIARDVTERAEREDRIEGLHRATRRLMAAETKRAVAERTAEAADTTLGFPLTVVRFLEDEDRLVPAVISEAREELDGERPVYTVGQPPAGRAFERGETLVYEDVPDFDDDVERTPGGSMYIPIGEHGVLTISGTEHGEFDGSDVDVAEILAANAESALDRVGRAQRLRRQNERLEEFVSVVSHDLRNPLNVIEGRLELAREECDSDHLDEAAGALARSQTLVDDLLTLARRGERIDEVEPVDLRALLERVERHVDLGDARLAVETDCTVRADPSRLRQLLANLLRNSVEHGSTSSRTKAGDLVEHGPTSGRTKTGDGVDHGGAAVTITVGDLDDGFYVADDGPGIPEDDHGRVFDVGYSTGDEGTGFGLSIVERICDAHGWEVRVVESENGGARFEITGVEGIG